MTKQSTNPATTTRRAERREDSAFGKIAVDMGILTQTQLERCVAEQKKLAKAGKYVRLGKLLTRRKYLSTKDFLVVLSRQNKTILTCPSCAAQYNVKSQLPGKRLRCKHCKEVLTVPSEIETLTVQDTLQGAARSDTRLEAQSKAFGNYNVLEEIARGGMGIVFRAKQQGFDRDVALKVLKRDRINSEESLQRFFREARLAGQLNHPNIVAVYEVGECEGEPYFAMAYVKGRSLEEVLRNDSLPKNRALELMETIANTIHYAHEQEIVHRDLKPGNILIDEDGRPRLTDFGLAKHLDGQSLTQSGIDIGTPHYMSPEQVLGQVELIDERSDIYSLGVMLYQTMTRRLPFGGKSAIEIYHKILNHTPAKPSTLKRGLPRELDVVCAKAMTRNPSHRYATAAEFAMDVQRLRTGEPILAKPPSPIVRVLWTLKHHRGACVGGVFLAVLLLLAAGLIKHQWEKDQNATPPSKQPLAKKPSPSKPPERNPDTKLGPVEQLTMRAETALLQQRLAEAEKHLQQALRLAPKNFKLHFLLGRIYEGTREPEKAEAAYRNSIAENPAHWEAVFRLGRVLFYQDKMKEAKAKFSRVIALGKAVPAQFRSESYRMRARCYYFFKEDVAAIDDFEQALNLNPKNYLAHHWLGILYFAHMKLYGPAKVEFNRALNIKKHYVESLLFRGACSAYLEEFDSAFDDFSNAYDRDPQLCHNLIERGFESDYDARRYEVDVKEAKRFLTNLQGHVQALVKKGKISNYKFGLYMGLYAHYTGKYEAAVISLSAAIRGAPFEQKRRLYIFRGLSLDMLGKHEQAIEDFSRALTTKPKDVFGRLHRGTSYLKLNQLEKAKEDLEFVAREDTNEVRAAMHLGMIALLDQRHDGAKKWLEQALKIAPSDSRCHSLYAWFKSQAPAPHRDLAAASREALTGLTLNRKVPLSWGMLGVILEAQGDKEKAKAHYEKALAAKPKHWFFTPAFYKSRLKH